VLLYHMCNASDSHFVFKEISFLLKTHLTLSLNLNVHMHLRKLIREAMVILYHNQSRQ